MFLFIIGSPKGNRTPDFQDVRLRRIRLGRKNLNIKTILHRQGDSNP